MCIAIIQNIELDFSHLQHVSVTSEGPPASAVTRQGDADARIILPAGNATGWLFIYFFISQIYVSSYFVLTSISAGYNAFILLGWLVTSEGHHRDEDIPTFPAVASRPIQMNKLVFIQLLIWLTFPA